MSTMSRDEIDKLWGSMADADKRRKKNYPTEQHCLRAMFDCMQRLRELGWKEAMYGPKDGSIVESISFGSTGIHKANYHGDWPSGGWWVHDAGDLWSGSNVLMVRETASDGKP